MSDPTPNLHSQEADKAVSASAERPDRKFEQLASIHQMIADLSEWAKEQDTNNREAEEMHEKMFYSKLPEALFHATTQANARIIMLEGLKPHRLEFEPDEVVSLSDTISFAKFCASITQSTDDLVILEITSQGLKREQAKSFLQLPNKIKPGEPLHEVHYFETINSDYIRQLSQAKVTELEITEI